MSRRRGLTPEEEALWRKAMRDVAPYRSKRPIADKAVSAPQPAAAPGLLATRRRNAGPVSGAEARPLARRTQHPFQAGDPKLDRLAGRGRLPIDAVLDLHGHSQRTAETAFRRFVADSHGRGARCVLVITGKGTPELAGSAHHSQGHGQGQGRGVLRARLHDWLEQEPLRRLVSRASAAHPRHGGGGAFYIFLKR